MVTAAAIPATRPATAVAPIVNLRLVLAREAALMRACCRWDSLNALRVMLRRVLCRLVEDGLLQRLNLALMLLDRVVRGKRRSVRGCHVMFFHVVHILSAS